MDYLKNSKDWQNPSFLIWLLHERTQELKSFTRGISEEEFDTLCRNDMFLRKNLELEVRDIETVVKQLDHVLQKI